MLSVLCLNIHIASGFGELNEADVCLPWCLAVYIMIALFYRLLLCHSCFKMNIGFCPSSIYFLALMEALPHVNAVYLSVVLLVYYFTRFIIFALLILVLELSF